MAGNLQRHDRVQRSWQRGWFGSAVPVSEAGQTEMPQSLATPALAGFEQPVETGEKSAMTT